MEDLAANLDADGWALVDRLLLADQCDELVRAYDDASRYRKRIVMERHGYGRGDYSYFAYPLPPMVAALRKRLYEQLVPIANRWNERLARAERFPPTLAAFTKRCHEAGQTRPTPLILRYGAGDYNCLHQDLYGENVFPLQVAIALSEAGVDYDGGELVITEQRPRRQSRVSVVPLRKGDAVVFAVNERPANGARGTYRVMHRHGVSALRSGTRFTLGIIFHDAT